MTGIIKAPFIKDSAGNYTATRDFGEDEIILLARAIVTERFRRLASLNAPKDARDYLLMELGQEEHEIFAVIFLDNRHRVIAFEKMFHGTIDGASVHPREVVKRALFHNASAVVLSHNHPSGVTEPSEADKRITTRLAEALRLVDVRVLDHIIVSGVSTTSFAERGLI